MVDADLREDLVVVDGGVDWPVEITFICSPNNPNVTEHLTKTMYTNIYSNNVFKYAEMNQHYLVE